MYTRKYPRTALEAFKHLDHQYGNWWEGHYPINVNKERSIIKIAVVVAVAASVLALLV